MDDLIIVPVILQSSARSRPDIDPELLREAYDATLAESSFDGQDIRVAGRVALGVLLFQRMGRESAELELRRWPRAALAVLEEGADLALLEWTGELYARKLDADEQGLALALEGAVEAVVDFLAKRLEVVIKGGFLDLMPAAVLLGDDLVAFTVARSGRAAVDGPHDVTASWSDGSAATTPWLADTEVLAVRLRAARSETSMPASPSERGSEAP